MKLRAFSSSLLFATVAQSFVAAPAAAQLDLSLGGLLRTPRFGCFWTNVNDTNTNNTGFLDSTATYTISTIPAVVPEGARIVIRGRYPKTRYFSFQLYNGFRAGNFVDSVPDAAIISRAGGAPDPNPAVTPDREDGLAEYEVQVIYEDAPANRADRLPNTLYAGRGAFAVSFNKTIVFRTYLPDVGETGLGGAPLPDLVYEGPDRTIDLRETPDQGACNGVGFLTNALRVFPVPAIGQGQAGVRFTALSGRGATIFYPNGDSNYLRAQTGRAYAPLLIVRAKLPVTPSRPELGPPDVRYYSLCQNNLNTSRNIACLSDRDAVVQADGSFTAVISQPEDRPALAVPASGYNWLPFGTQINGFTVLRQILARPGFEGDFANALANPNAPQTETLGSFAPEITYCDRATFDATAASGGAALVAACRENFRPLGNLAGGLLRR